MADGLGIFRKQDFGDVEVDVNSKRMNQDRYIDQSRLSTRYVEEYVSSDTPGKYGTYVGRTEVTSPADNARAACDAMKHRSSFRDESVPANDGGGNCCTPSVYGYGGDGPLTRRRGEG